MGKPYSLISQVSSLVPTRTPVLLYDAIEDLFSWSISGDGNASGDKNSELAYRGNYSMIIQTRNIEGQAGDMVLAQRYFPMSPSKFVDLSAFFLIPIIANLSELRFQLDFDDGTTLMRSQVAYSPVLHQWYYNDSDGNLTAIAGANVPLAQYVWNRFRLSVNFTNGTFVDFEINNAHYSLLNLSFQQPPSSGYQVANLSIRLTNTAAGVAIGDFDEVLVAELTL